MPNFKLRVTTFCNMVYVAEAVVINFILSDEFYLIEAHAVFVKSHFKLPFYYLKKVLNFAN